MRLKRPPFFSFIFILLVGLLASKPLFAQKKFSLPKIHFGMPHFKPLFKKDSTNKIFNPNHWFKYKKEQPYTKNENAMPIAVGYTDFDENIRDLQLLGKLPTDNSLTIRPYILPKSVTYDSLLKAIDPSIENNGHLVHKKHFDLQLLPINFLQKYNSHHPFGWNDGPLSFSKGYQYLVSGGVYMHWRNIHLTLRPEYFRTASDQYDTSKNWGQVNPSLNYFVLGQSSFKIDLGPIRFGIGTNNMWRGPGIISTLLMTNNAQGFNHFEISNKKSLRLPIGNIEFSIFGGTLIQNPSQGFENRLLKRTNIDPYTKYINFISITYNPVLFKNLYLGGNRVFIQPTLQGRSKNFKVDYMPVLLPFFRNVYQDNALPIDQIISGFVKYLFVKEKAEVYFEYGWNDGKSNLRDLLLDNSHSSASVLGFKKLFYLKKDLYLNIDFEATRMAQTPSYLQRQAGNWYVHMYTGYSNQNQILGAGSGWGNNLQTLSLSLNKNYTKIGAKFQNILQNPTGEINLFDMSGGLPQWRDFTYGVIFKKKFNKLFLNLNFDFVKSQNYARIENYNAQNYHIFLNTIYVW